MRVSGQAWFTTHSLTFTQSNWNTAQTIEVRALHDHNAADAMTHITNFIEKAHTVADFDNAPNKLLTVNIDDETAAIVVSERMLAVTEGADVSYTVRLSHVPRARVRVTMLCDTYGSLRMAGNSGGPYYSGVTYTYTASTWNTGQTVYVTGWEDANRTNERVTIWHSVYVQQSSSEYRAAHETLTVNVMDNDAGRW